MAIPKIKATYSLDRDTVRLLEQVSRRWGFSRSEALRRAIRASVSLPAGKDRSTALLDRLQRAAAVNSRIAARWQREVRAERRAGRRG